jgi:hypothetical protein
MRRNSKVILKAALMLTFVSILAYTVTRGVVTKTEVSGTIKDVRLRSGKEIKINAKINIRVSSVFYFNILLDADKICE